MTTPKTIQNELNKLEVKRAELQSKFNEPNADFKFLGMQEDLIDEAIEALVKVREVYQEDNETELSQEDLMNLMA